MSKNYKMVLMKGNTQVTAYVSFRMWDGSEWVDIIRDKGYLIFWDDLFDEDDDYNEGDFWTAFCEYVLNDINNKYNLNINIDDIDVKWY